MPPTCAARAPPIQTSTSGLPPTWLRCLTPSPRGTDSTCQARGPAPAAVSHTVHRQPRHRPSRMPPRPRDIRPMAELQNAQPTLTEPGRHGGLAAVGAAVAAAHRGTSIMFARRGSGMVREVVEDDPGVAGRLAWLAARLTIRPALAIGSHLANVPWPWGLIDCAAKAVTPAPGSVRATIRLPHCGARLVRATGVLPADGTRGVVLYLHGGGFLTCGANTHDRLVTTLSKYADTPVLVMNYRMMPKHSVGEAIDDCYDGYRWLRGRGYRPDQVVLAGDSAGCYLSLALAERLLNEGGG